MSTKNIQINSLQSTREHILALLLAAEGWCSGEALSRGLGMSRAAIAKHIAVLRDEGHEIEAAPRRGYHLLPGEAYTEATIRHDLHTRVIGQGKWLWLKETASTNQEAAALAASGAPDGSIVVADRQRAGRGRRGREWFTSPGSLAFSVLLRAPRDRGAVPGGPGTGSLPPDLKAEALPDFLLMLLAAVGEAVRQTTGVKVQAKKPNDLLINGRKCCGVLVETGTEVDEVTWLILGVGLNVNALEADFPPILRESVTSLRLATGTHVNRAALLQAILRALDAALPHK